VRRDTFGYALDPSLIANAPLANREDSRLMVVGQDKPHRVMRDLVDLMVPGTVLVVNNSRVIPARLLGVKAGSGGAAEIFLVRKHEDGTWQALGRSSKPLRPGTVVECGPLAVEVLEKSEDGTLRIRTNAGANESALLTQVGHMPLPPYIKRKDEESDREHYQTVYATREGSVAAPTAGLHFSEALLSALKAKGVYVAEVTLHVGLGTFQPVTVEDLDSHPMHEEQYEISETAAETIELARKENRPVLAVGTTVVRTLESALVAANSTELRASRGRTRLLIQPGFRFQVVDQLITNFHLPESTLLSLVCAFSGTERVLAAYKEAMDLRYRFFSYGDAMLLRRS
jgi:S-adenosylmethionine:tRNA ribosyltransferase-isomerase